MHDTCYKESVMPLCDDLHVFFGGDIFWLPFVNERILERTDLGAVKSIPSKWKNVQRLTDVRSLFNKIIIFEP